MEKIHYKGVLIGYGLREESNNAFYFEPVSEFSKQRIPFFKGVKEKLLSGSFDASDVFRIVGIENSVLGIYPTLDENMERLCFERFDTAFQEEFEFFFTLLTPFSQFYPCDLEIKGQKFNCTEQYYMYQKAMRFEDFESAEAILNEPMAGKQKRLGKKVKNFEIERWLDIARLVVYEANYAKFIQYKDLQKHLLSSYPKTLVEASPRDMIWGIGIGEDKTDGYDRRKWTGTNWLGEALIQVREDILFEQKASQE